MLVVKQCLFCILHFELSTIGSDHVNHIVCYKSFVIVRVPPRRAPSNEKKKDYTKCERCYYCDQYFTSRMSRHLTRMHSIQPVVAAAVAEKDPQKKARMMQKIQNLGNFVHNIDVSLQTDTAFIELFAVGHCNM